MRRLLDVPGEREFELAGEARISAQAPDPLVDRLLGIPGAPRRRHHRPVVGPPRRVTWPPGPPRPSTATRRRPGRPPSTTSRASSSSTSCPRSQTVDHLDLQVVADGRHSVPTRLRLKAGDEVRELEVPAARGRRPSPTASPRSPSTSSPVEADTLPPHRPRGPPGDDRPTGTAAATRSCPSPSPRSACPASSAPSPPRRCPDRCHDDLLTVDGEAVPVRLSGTTADAEARLPLPIEACEGPIDGRRRDRPAGSPGPGRRHRPRRPGPLLRPRRRGRRPGRHRDHRRGPAASTSRRPTSWSTRPTADADEPFWLVVGESYGPEWDAAVEGGDGGRATRSSRATPTASTSSPTATARSGVDRDLAPAAPGLAGHRHLARRPAASAWSCSWSTRAAGSATCSTRRPASTLLWPPGPRTASSASARRCWPRAGALVAGVVLATPAGGRRPRRGHVRLAAPGLGRDRRPPGRGGRRARRQPLHLRQAAHRQPAAGLRLAAELRRRPTGSPWAPCWPSASTSSPSSSGAGGRPSREAACALVARRPSSSSSSWPRSGPGPSRPTCPSPSLWTDDTTTVKVAQLDALRLRRPRLRRQLDDPGRARPPPLRRDRHRGAAHLQRRPGRGHPGPARALGARRGRSPGRPRRRGPGPVQLRPQRRGLHRPVRPRGLRRRPADPGRLLRTAPGPVHPHLRPVRVPQRAAGPRGGLGRPRRAGGTASASPGSAPRASRA